MQGFTQVLTRTRKTSTPWQARLVIVPKCTLGFLSHNTEISVWFVKVYEDMLMSYLFMYITLLTLICQHFILACSCFSQVRVHPHFCAGFWIFLNSFKTFPNTFWNINGAITVAYTLYIKWALLFLCLKGTHAHSWAFCLFLSKPTIYPDYLSLHL